MKNYLPKILITGGHGQVGHAIRHHPQAAKFRVTACSHAELDITDIANVHNAINAYEPDIIINTAAYTAVDRAEKDSEACIRTNHLGAMNLAIACRKEKVKLVHMSTDYIFDGTKGSPYQEDDAATPLNFYGKSKWLGEQAIREQSGKHVILRVSGVFSGYGNNFYKTILRLAKERKTLSVVCDQITCPTSADDIASALFKICKNIKKFGVYHYCSDKPVSWYEFASTILIQAQQYTSLAMEELQAITTAEYPTLAKRPPYSVLDCGKIKKDYGVVQKPWEAAVKLFIQTGQQ